MPSEEFARFKLDLKALCDNHDIDKLIKTEPPICYGISCVDCEFSKRKTCLLLILAKFSKSIDKKNIRNSENE